MGSLTRRARALDGYGAMLPQFEAGGLAGEDIIASVRQRGIGEDRTAQVRGGQTRRFEGGEVRIRLPQVCAF